MTFTLPLISGGTGGTDAASTRLNLNLDQVTNTSDAAKILIGNPIGDAISFATKIYSDVNTASSTIIPSSTKGLRVLGYASPSDHGAAQYTRVDIEPKHPGKFRSADRFLSTGVTGTTNGGWWELQEQIVRPEMFGAFGCDVGATTTIQANTALAETPRWQALADYAMYMGAKIEYYGFGGTVMYPIRSTITFTAQRAPTTIGNINASNVSDPTLPILAHYCNHPEVEIKGIGNAEIIAI